MLEVRQLPRKNRVGRLPRYLKHSSMKEGGGDDGPSVEGGYHPHEGRLRVPPRSFGPNKMPGGGGGRGALSEVGKYPIPK